MKRHTYSPGFLRAWSLYPHCQSKQRSSKIESFRVWQRLRLEKRVDRVCLWIEALDVDREFAKGFQSYLRKTDFSDDPPASQGIKQSSRIPTREEFDAAIPPEWEPR